MSTGFTFYFQILIPNYWFHLQTIRNFKKTLNATTEHHDDVDVDVVNDVDLSINIIHKNLLKITFLNLCQ